MSGRRVGDDGLVGNDGLTSDDGLVGDERIVGKLGRRRADRLMVMARRRVLVGGPTIAGPSLAVPGIGGLRLAGPGRPGVMASGMVDAAAHAGQATRFRRR